MRLALRNEMREIDQRTSREFGISEKQLMENAGAAMAKKIQGRRIAVLCGPGNNGGDGLVVAKHLSKRTDVEVFQLANNFEGFDSKNFDVIVDAIFGIGLDRPLPADLGRFIQNLNKQKKNIVSVDVPTGLDVNTGMVWGAAINASCTLSCGLAKPGFYLNEGPGHCGRIEILDIGFPKKLVEEVANSTFLIGKNSAKSLLPQRRSGANKSKFGKLLLIAGSSNMAGASILAGNAAARMGVGYVVIASPADLAAKIPPDFLTISWDKILQTDFSNYSAVAIGPGMGQTAEVGKILKKLKEQKIEKVMIDADAITACVKENFWPLPKTWLLTPHAGEMSRVLGILSQEIEADRLAAAKKAEEVTGAAILLKGFRTVVQSNKKSYIVGSGNVALAKAGTGDVLTGFISSLMAQGLSTDRAAALGAYLHGKIADDWISQGGDSRTLMASDLPDMLNKTLKELQS